MKKAFVILSLSILYSTGYAQEKQKDIESIKKMCGCYEVEFNFQEIFQASTDSTYKPSPVKKDHGLEWIELIEEAPNKLVLQHLLIANEKMIIKHWRQDWLYENTNLYEFYKDNTWKFNQLKAKDVKGQWTQKVYQVDDSPRYEGTGTWIHKDGKNYWMNITDAPLPRREETIRKDYNVLERRNIHEITKYGWLHEQDNRKIIRNDKGNDTEVAKEKGLDIYVKVDDSKCKSAQDWWSENNKLWSNVRAKWQTIFDRNQTISLEEKIEHKQLYRHLFGLKPSAKKAETDKIIDSFLK